MKVARGYLGKYVEIRWKDPAANRVKSHVPDRSDLPRGRAGLATWIEFGVIDDITDGVVRLCQSRGIEPGAKDPDEFFFGWFPEDLIEEITVLTREGTNAIRQAD